MFELIFTLFRYYHPEITKIIVVNVAYHVCFLDFVDSRVAIFIAAPIFG